MSIEQMEYMLALEQEKKISYAARRCFISQPALSQQLAKIEKELGTSLFSRQNNEYVPTEEGRLLLDSFQKILYIYHSALHDLERLHSVSEKCITLGMPTLRAATLYAYIYSRFRYQFPGYDMRLLEISVTSTLEMLEEQKIDFGLFSPYQQIPEALQDYCSYHSVGDEELVLIAPKGHRLALASSEDHRMDIRVLGNETLALYPPGYIVRNLVEVYLKKYHIACRAIINFKSVSTIFQFVKQNLALSIVPYTFAANDPDLAIIHLNPLMTQEIGCLSPSQYKGSEIESAVIQLFKEAFQNATVK